MANYITHLSLDEESLISSQATSTNLTYGTAKEFVQNWIGKTINDAIAKLRAPAPRTPSQKKTSQATPKKKRKRREALAST